MLLHIIRIYIHIYMIQCWVSPPTHGVGGGGCAGGGSSSTNNNSIINSTSSNNNSSRSRSSCRSISTSRSSMYA